MMRIFKGTAVSPGYAEGKALVCGPEWDMEIPIPNYRIDKDAISGEQERLRQAIQQASRELDNLHDEVRTLLGQEIADIFAVHLMILQDSRFNAKVMARVERDLINVEQAFTQEIAAFNAHLAKANVYFQERASDIRDIGRQILRHLTRSEEKRLANLPPNTVVIASNLLPSDTVHLMRAPNSAVVTEHGGETSHLAILARAAGMPAIMGAEGIVREVTDGMHVLVDCEHAEVIISPTWERSVSFALAREAFEELTSLAAAAERQPCVTTDGEEVRLYANIGQPEDAREVQLHNLEGVGLFRTEMHFLDCPEPPTFEQQLHAYRTAAGHLDGRPITIRVFDLGGDKEPRFLTPKFERGHALGIRGLRFLLIEPGLLETQVAAIVETGREHPVRILFPMVFDGDDLARAVEIVQETAAKCQAPCPPIGAMIETATALFTLEDILENADFLTIGTNDLVQFMLAADREAASVLSDDSVLHPGILRAIERVVTIAHERGKTVSVCGEAAGDPRIAVLLLGLGIHELSMCASRAARVRLAMRNTSGRAAIALAQRALASHSAADVRQLVLSRAGAAGHRGTGRDEANGGVNQHADDDPETAQ